MPVEMKFNKAVVKANPITGMTFTPMPMPTKIPPLRPTPVQPTGIFTPKPGGTDLGNALRAVANTVSGGHFGTGNMKIQPGETEAEYYNRLAKAAGAAAETFNNTSSQSTKQTNMADSFKAGVAGEAITGTIMKLLPTVVIGVVGFIVLKKFVFTPKGSKRSY